MRKGIEIGDAKLLVILKMKFTAKREPFRLEWGCHEKPESLGRELARANWLSNIITAESSIKGHASILGAWIRCLCRTKCTGYFLWRFRFHSITEERSTRMTSVSWKKESEIDTIWLYGILRDACWRRGSTSTRHLAMSFLGWGWTATSCHANFDWLKLRVSWPSC